MVASYLPRDVQVFFQAENGLIGMQPLPDPGLADEYLSDPGGSFVGAVPGACSFDSCMSFGLIRGGHLDITVLGGLEVDEQGLLANWMVPGKMVPGMGGAMDLVTGARRVIVAMLHTAKGKAENSEAVHASLDVDAPGQPRRHRACGARTDSGGLGAEGGRAWCNAA